MSSTGSGSSSSMPQRGTGGSQRASEINSAMLNVPCYADDSLTFMMRYGSLAKDTLRKVDWEEFQLRLHAMHVQWSESHQSNSSSSSAVVGSRGTGESDGANAAATSSSRDFQDSPIGGGRGVDDDAVDPSGPAPEPETMTEPEPGAEEAAELKARALELVQDFPHLVRDFDRFFECTRMVAARYKR